MKVTEKTVRFRFYEELNDFLPFKLKKKRFEHRFIDAASVKDMIQSLGVPHTEIDLILVNGTSVTFDYTVKDGDDISVYPVFESLNITEVQHLRANPLRNAKFVCDVHLGRLAKNLRMAGFDTQYKNDLGDKEIVKIALREKRTILTRDLGLLKRNEVEHGYYVRNTDPEKQIIEVILRFDLQKQIVEFSRCIECNFVLLNVGKEEIIELLPPKVQESQNDFYQCPECKKIYWRGSHYKNMLGNINKLKKLTAQ